MKYEELKLGVSLKDKKGEIIKCNCGGTYKWNGSIKPCYPAKYTFICDKCSDRLLIGGQHLFPEEYSEFRMRLWIGRDNPIIPEDMEHYIEKHPKDEIQYAKLHVFYDKPVWKDGRWCNAREMCEIKNHMFSEIKSGECVEFKSVQL